jgi:hypothetical protein
MAAVGIHPIETLSVSGPFLRPCLAEVYQRVIEGNFSRVLGENTLVTQNTRLHHKPLPNQYSPLIYPSGRRELFYNQHVKKIYNKNSKITVTTENNLPC